MIIRDLLGLKPPTQYKNNKATQQDCADAQLLYGVELEIENIQDADALVYGIGGINHIEDGSLRNNGREFITQPMTFSVKQHVLSNFFGKAGFTARNYSDRTSVHVHCNVQDLSPEELASVLLLYQVYEGLLYDFVGGERDKNIFCVPWSETQLSFSIINSLSSGDSAKIIGLKNWQKYTGLNLLPIFSQGTIEFRQMPGTADLQHILNWLNLIGSLFNYSRKNNLKDIKAKFVELNTTSAYRTLTEQVFNQWAYLLLSNSQYWNKMEEGVLNMKYMLLQDKSKNSSKSLDELVARMQREAIRPAPRDPGLRFIAPPTDFNWEAVRTEARNIANVIIGTPAARGAIVGGNAPRLDPIDFEIHDSIQPEQGDL